MLSLGLGQGLPSRTIPHLIPERARAPQVRPQYVSKACSLVGMAVEEVYARGLVTTRLWRLTVRPPFCPVVVWWAFTTTESRVQRICPVYAPRSFVFVETVIFRRWDCIERNSLVPAQHRRALRKIWQ